MATATAVIEKNILKPSKIVSLTTFFSKYATAKDGFKYEYNNGIIEKTLRMVTKKQWFIIDNIERHFAQTAAYKRGDTIFREPEVWTSDLQVRAPDMAYLTKKQIRKEPDDEKTMSPFLIEVVSPTDRMYKVNAKIREYFNAGTSVVWLILPDSKEVYVYTSPTQIQVCEGTTKCFAGSFLPDFDISAADIFNR